MSLSLSDVLPPTKNNSNKQKQRVKVSPIANKTQIKASQFAGWPLLVPGQSEPFPGIFTWQHLGVGVGFWCPEKQGRGVESLRSGLPEPDLCVEKVHEWAE